MIRLPLPTRRVVLGVDQAGSSGFCVNVGSTPARHGVVTTAHGRSEVLKQAQMFAHEYHVLTHNDQTVPWFVFVFEDHTMVGRRQKGHGTLIGQLHRWFEQLDLMGHPAYLRIGATPNEWQGAVLGCSSRTPRAERKRAALAWASERVKAPLSSEDQADAICIAAWGSVDGLRALERRRWAGQHKTLAKAAKRAPRKRRAG